MAATRAFVHVSARELSAASSSSNCLRAAMVCLPSHSSCAPRVSSLGCLYECMCGCTFVTG